MRRFLKKIRQFGFSVRENHFPSTKGSFWYFLAITFVNFTWRSSEHISKNAIFDPYVPPLDVLVLLTLVTTIGQRFETDENGVFGYELRCSTFLALKNKVPTISSIILFATS